MTDEQVTPVTENVTPEEQVVPEVAPAEPAENATPMVQLPPEKVAEYKRKLTASRDEALRLKRENEELKSKFSQPEPIINQVNPTDIEYFKELAKLSGVSFQEDVQNIQKEKYEDKKTQAVQQFLANHPEYAKVGDDQSDALWATLEEKMKKYQTPSDPSEWYDMLEEGHKVLHYDTKTAYEKGKALGYAQANIQEKSRVGGGSPNAVERKVPAQKKQILDGFKQARPQYFN